MKGYGKLAILLTFVSQITLCAQSDNNYLITVSDLRTVESSDNTDPAVRQDLYYVTFTGTVLNSSKHVITVPEGLLNIIVSEMQLPSGGWKTIVGSPSRIGTEASKEARCVNVKPRKTLLLPHLSGMVVFEKANQTRRSSAFVRFQYYGECLDKSGWRTSKFVTEPILIKY